MLQIIVVAMLGFALFEIFKFIKEYCTIELFKEIKFHLTNENKITKMLNVKNKFLIVVVNLSITTLLVFCFFVRLGTF